MTYIVSTDIRTLLVTTNEEKAVKVYNETVLSNYYNLVRLERFEGNTITTIQTLRV